MLRFGNDFVARQAGPCRKIIFNGGVGRKNFQYLIWFKRAKMFAYEDEQTVATIEVCTIKGGIGFLGMNRIPFHDLSPSRKEKGRPMP